MVCSRNGPMRSDQMMSVVEFVMCACACVLCMLYFNKTFWKYSNGQFRVESLYIVVLSFSDSRSFRSSLSSILHLIFRHHSQPK